MPTLESLHELLDRVPVSAFDEAEAALSRLADEREPSSLRKFLEASPDDDEPLTDEDIQAIDAARADLRAGNLVSHAQVLEMVKSWPKD